ncbi:SDR family oxidoreductase [Sandaracinobacter sp. RS1-74]|uniref:SDR family oxidoreductase n=1 Tax=Sandaracinobacteroides sayramensis TaxID=2913411 RepID=UPI001EDC0B4B|nr:SDR family oxidoreductase [Sandaracinobacteroides sayramensis]MCG2840549.1 SDR family oxidoreductase [Sandaracinobacteroides sayramensis]
MSSGLDLGLTGRKAIVCGSSSGLGLACARALADCGVELVLNGRHREKLEAAAEAIAARTGNAPAIVAADVATPEGRAQLLSACPDPDVLVTNAGGPPAGDFRSFDEATWLAAIQANMLSAIFLINGVVDGMIARGWGRIINITSAAVKAPMAPLALSNGARSGLTGFVAGVSRQVAPHGVTINNLLPGPFATDRLTGFAARMGAERGVGADAVMAEMAGAVPMGRVGDPDEFGAWCAFVASRQASFMTGQNLVLDGGGYPGML